MNFVLDASVSLAWCFSDEATTKTTALLDHLKDFSAYVPSLWSLELGNVLLGAQRRKRISYAQITEFITLLEALHIIIDHESDTRHFHEILSLAHAENLTTYGATYLELAMRLGLPLATKDIALANAATRLGIHIIS